MNAKMVTESVGHGPAQNSEPSSYNHSAEESANESVSSPFEVWSPSSHELSIMVVLSILSLMVSLDASVIVTSLNAMVLDLGISSTQGFWIGTSYLLANAAAMPMIAAVSDIFGRTLLLMGSLVVFSAGTIMCSVTNEISVMLAGRSLQGVGGGGIVVLALVIFTDIVPLRLRPKWYGMVLGAWALGTCTGPPIGGAIAQNATWRWIFYMVFPFLAVGLVAVPVLLTLKPPSATFRQRLGEVDWLGGALFTFSVTIFLVAISWGGLQFAWNSWQTILPLVAGIVGIAGAIYYEGWWAKRPILLSRLFHDLSSTVTYLCGSFQGLLLFGSFYYLAWFFISVKEFSALDAGVAILPAAGATVPSAIVCGGIITRTGYYRWAIWVGWILSTVGLAVTSTWDERTSTGVWAGTLVISGLGHGCLLNAQNFAAQAQCRPGDEGAAAAMYAFVRQLGAAMGVGIGGSIFQNVMALKLGWVGLDTSIAQEAEAYVFVLNALPDGDPFKIKAISAYVYGFQGVWWTYVALSGLALVMSLAIKHQDMNRRISTIHTLEKSKVAPLLRFDARHKTEAQASGSPV